jgi:hypothetical protein
MPLNKSAANFLLRGSLLLVAFLTLWWLVLRGPMLFLLRLSAEIPLRLLAGSAASLTVDPSGDWAFRLPVTDAGFRSIDFTIPRSDLMVFTFGLPVYWAIALAAAPRALRVLIKGSALLAAVELLALLGFVKIEAWSVMAQLHSSSSGFIEWSLELGNYLTANVIPDTAPFLIAVALHRELRLQIFSSHSSPALPPKAPVIQRPLPRKRAD